MNGDSEGTVLRDSRVFTNQGKLTIAFVLVTIPCLLILLWLGYTNNIFTNLLGGDQDTELVLETKAPAGYIYLSAQVEAGEGVMVPGIFRFSFEDNDYAFIQEAAYSYSANESGPDYMIAYQDGTTDPDNYQVVARTREEGIMSSIEQLAVYADRDLAVAPAGDFVAYSFRTSSAGDLSNLDEWNISLQSVFGGQPYIIEQAAEPVWMYNGASLLYMKKDGIYMRDLAAGTDTRLIAKYENLSISDDIAASGKNIVVTIPSLNLTAIYEESVSGDGLTLSFVPTHEITDSTKEFRSPVISPDGDFIGLVSSSADTSTVNPVFMALSTKTGEVIYSYDIAGVDLSEYVDLNQWRY